MVLTNAQVGALQRTLLFRDGSVSDMAASPRHFRFSNRPFEVKRFQTIRRSGVDVTHGLVLLFGIGTKAVPSWHLENEVEQSFPRPCRQMSSSSGRQYFQFKPTRSTLPSNFWLAFMKSFSAAVKLSAAATE